MALIADSDAVYDIKRILPQHQSAITLLNAKLQNPAIHELKWLDLACGKGQIISQLEENLSEINRNKLTYTGYDISETHTRTADRIASSLKLKSFNFVHGDMSNFSKLIPEEEKFDFITCTNTAHELQPGAFAQLMIDSLLHLTDTGELFIYDMEALAIDKLELGALPWCGSEINALVNSIFEILNTSFRVHASTWSHTLCKGWTITIQRQYLSKNNEEIMDQREAIIDSLDKTIDQILESRFTECNQLLKSYYRYGTETADDVNSKISALYEFWALSQAKELRK